MERRSASDSAAIEDSRALTASTMGWYLALVRSEASEPPKSLPSPPKTWAVTRGRRAAEEGEGEEEEEEAEEEEVGGGENDSGDFLLLLLLLLAFEAPATLFAPASARAATPLPLPTSTQRRSDEAAAGLERGAAFGARPAATRVATRLADAVDDEGCIALSSGGCFSARESEKTRVERSR